MAEGLEVGLVPEQGLVTLVRDDVVNVRARGRYALGVAAGVFRAKAVQALAA